MSDPLPEKPKRRVRYSGKNPRKFHEKYKEHSPGQYADDVAKVIASGKTPAGMHRPIMVKEIMEVLDPQPGNTAVDCTLGYGGHAMELLRAVQPGGRLIGIDTDPIELPKTEARLRDAGFASESIVVRRTNYAGIVRLLTQEAPGGADILLADLGLSSMQIDNPDRGFSFKINAPLDMRMNPEKGLSAAGLIARSTAKEITRWLGDYSDEPCAELIAGAIVQTPGISTTAELVNLVRKSLPAKMKPEEIENTVRRVFQAVRIAVNDELGALDMFLRNLPLCLKPGGRLAILTFHSGEDRRVKHALKAGLQSGDYSSIADTVLRPSAEEQHANSRSRPAKLRWAIRAGC